MADTMTAAQRQRCMAKIRGKNTKPELLLRKALWKSGFRYRIHFKIKGSPDIVFLKRKMAVFVDGCFWHGCPIHSHMPKSNGVYWKAKFARNMERDQRVTRELQSAGWAVVRIWEHEVKNSLISTVAAVISMLTGSAPSTEFGRQ